MRTLFVLRSRPLIPGRMLLSCRGSAATFRNPLRLDSFLVYSRTSAAVRAHRRFRLAKRRLRLVPAGGIPLRDSL
jgi:hypothetical protein